MTQGIRTYWDRPLEIEWDLHLDTLRRSIKNAAPMQSGALRRAFDRPGVITFNESEMAIDIHISDPSDPAYRYAKIQNQGGYVPPFNIRTARPNPRLGRPYKSVMRARIGGMVRFFTKRRGFTLRGSDYIFRGVVAWEAELKRKLKQGTVVQWASGKAGRTFGRIKGIFKT